MRTYLTRLFILLTAFFLASCLPTAEQAAATAVAGTATASSPTPSPTETPTLTPTFTLTPSSTPTLTNTPTETPTPTLTYTPTNAATATPSLTPLPTHTPIPPTITPCPSDSKIFIENLTGDPVTITLFGPCIYVLNLAPGSNSFNVLAGYYDYTISLCGTVVSGSFTFKENGRYFVACQ